MSIAAQVAIFVLATFGVAIGLATCASVFLSARETPGPNDLDRPVGDRPYLPSLEEQEEVHAHVVGVHAPDLRRGQEFVHVDGEPQTGIAH